MVDLSGLTHLSETLINTTNLSATIWEASVHSDHHSNEDRIAWLLTRYGMIVAVFDGHYGPMTAEYTVKHLLNLIDERVSCDITRSNFQDIGDTLVKTIEDFDANLVEKAAEKVQSHDPNKDLAEWSMEFDTPAFLGMKEVGETDPYPVMHRACEGCTVLLCLLVRVNNGYKVWTASLGDSDGFIINKVDGSHEVTLVSEQHNVQNPDEASRLSDEHPSDANVLLRSRVKGQLGVTRAIGNAILKVNLPLALALSRMWGHPVHFTTVEEWQESKQHTPPYISSTPSIKCHDLRDGDMMILVSDGVRSTMGITSTELRDCITSILGHADNLALSIVQEALRKQVEDYRDDITAIVIGTKPGNGSHSDAVE